MAEVRRIGLDEVVAHFQEVEDPRSEINRRHPLASVVVIALLAVLAGAGGPTAIARWAELKREFLTQVLDLPHGIPGKDVFRRVLIALEPAAFQAGFAGWLRSLREGAVAATGVDRPVLPVDGKTVRRSHDRHNGLGALHCVSVWASEYGLSLGQVACDAKSNEITAIPELLRLVDLNGAILTIDAMGTQEADCRADHRRGRRLCAELEGEPRDGAPGGHRSHRRATRRGPLRGAGTPDDGDRSWA